MSDSFAPRFRSLRSTFVALTAAVALAAAGATANAAVGDAPPAQTTGGAVSSTPHKTAEFNGVVYALAYRGSTIYVGGDFTSAFYNGKTYPRQRLAAVNATTGALLPWAPTADKAVVGLAVDGSSVYATGSFAHVGGQKRDSIAKIDGDTGAVAAFKHTVSGTAKAVAAGNGLLYLVGHITAVDGHKRANTAAFSLATVYSTTAGSRPPTTPWRPSRPHPTGCTWAAASTARTRSAPPAG